MGSHHVRQLLDSDDDDDSGSQYPFWWIVVPVVIAIAIACMVIVLRYRRRQLRHTLAGCNSALRRDLEAMGPPSNHRPARAAAAGRPWYSGPAGQWRVRPNGLSRFARPHDEGLNEFGEAPPAYTPPRQKEQSAMDEIELGHVSPPQVDVTVPPTAAPATPAAGGVPERGGPPPYSEAQQQVNGTRPIPESVASPAEGPERPSPAVLGTR